MPTRITNAAAQLTVCAALAWANVAGATPSTTYWAPSTTYVQPFLVPHVTYDTYFWRGAVTGQPGSPLYPVDTGLTIGVLPFDALTLELGFDLLLPSPIPGSSTRRPASPRACSSRSRPRSHSASSAWEPRVRPTPFQAPTTTSCTARRRRDLPWGGYVSVGGYYGAGSRILWLGSDGNENRAGFMGAVAAPDINVNLPGLKKIVLVGDVQTGKNVFGAGGFGAYFYFTDTIDLLTGPVWFFDGDLQPGQRNLLWTVQVDVDIPLFAPRR